MPCRRGKFTGDFNETQRMRPAWPELLPGCRLNRPCQENHHDLTGVGVTAIPAMSPSTAILPKAPAAIIPSLNDPMAAATDHYGVYANICSGSKNAFLLMQITRFYCSRLFKKISPPSLQGFIYFLFTKLAADTHPLDGYGIHTRQVIRHRWYLVGNIPPQVGWHGSSTGC